MFAAGIAVESATREAAEAAANQYLSKPPGPLDSPAPSPDPSYYAALHTYAASVVCAELRGLPNTNFDSGTQTCPDMPVVEVCVHDSADSACDTNASPGSGTVPAGCGGLQTRPTNTHGGSGTPRWVEVRTCYHFTTILNTTIFSFGDFWLQRTRNFTIPCYFARGTDECG